MRFGLVVMVASLVGLSGCASWADCSDPGVWSVATPEVPLDYLRTDPTQSWDTLLLQPDHLGPGTTSLRLELDAASWDLQQQRLTPSAVAGNLSLVRVDPGMGPGTLVADYAVADEIEGACKTGNGGKFTWHLAEPEMGDTAGVGQGVHVMTAGFWENGTLFYTNIAEIDTDPAWPKAGWYAWEGAAALPVYVYGSDRSEQPLHWTDLQAGTPLAGTVPGLGYFTTIPGFNEALKGLSTTTTRVVHLAPEEAYTRPGNEDHPLYGDALVFYIKVLDVVDFPCPLWVDAGFCRLPDAPLATTPSAPHHG